MDRDLVYSFECGGSKMNKNKINKYLRYIGEFLLSFIIAQLFLGAIWFNNSFSRTTAEVKLFNLLTPLVGTQFMYCLKYALCTILPSIIVALVLIILIKKINKKWLYVFLLIISLCFALHQLGLFDYLSGNTRRSDFIQKNYVNPSDVGIEFKTKKNLIYIVLESIETTYASKQDGGYMKDNLIPNLTKIASDNISFSNTDKLGGSLYIDGTSYTMASILAQMSGLPLKIDFDMIHKYDFKKFYEGVTLGDILYENGYDNYIIMGSNSEFGAADVLYKNHHYKVSDLNTAIERGRMTKDDIVWWGYSDSDLFRYAKEELLDISKNERPFNYIINTMNTHFQDGYVEKDCKNVFGNQYYNVIYHSDAMINDFVNWVKEQDFYDDTVIVIVGDHITMDLKFCNSLPKDYNRTTYNVFINTGFEKEMVNYTNRLFTQMDMFPTTIKAIGGEIKGDKLGLGVNLFSNEKTIVEKYGYETIKSELNKRSSFYNLLMGTK